MKTSEAKVGFFGHVYATQSGDEDGEDMSPLLENSREDILRMSPTFRRDIYDASATCRVSRLRGTLRRHVISRQMKLSVTTSPLT